MEKRKILTPYAKRALIATCILIVIYTVISSLKTKDLYVFLSGMNSDEILPMLFLVIAVLCFTSMYSCNKTVIKHIWPLYVMTGCVSFIGFIYWFFCILLTPSFAYHDFYSSVGNHHLIVKEESFLLMGGGEIYEIVGPQLMKIIGSYGADDGYQPIKDKKYYFEWKEDKVILHYCFGHNLCEDESTYTSSEYVYAK